MKRLIYALMMLSSSLAIAQTDTTKIASDTTASNDTIPPDPDWKLSAITSLLANQANFTNWQAGGVNSMSYSAYLDLSADYAKDKWSWDNDLKLGFGQQFQEEIDWRKTDDILHYITKVGYALDTAKKWRATTAASFRTQFADGIEYPNDSTANKTSGWMAPGYVTVGLGIEYKPKNYVSFLLTPLTTKITIVQDQSLANDGRYGNEGAEYDNAGNVVTNGKNVRTEIGALFGIQFKKELIKNITYKSTLSLFSNYKENPQNVDVIFNNTLVFKVNKVINFTFVLDMIYDDDITITEYNDDGTFKSQGARLQIKQLLGFGLTYTIRNFTPPKPKK
jgi:hypothetical protein